MKLKIKLIDEGAIIVDPDGLNSNGLKYKVLYPQTSLRNIRSGFPLSSKLIQDFVNEINYDLDFLNSFNPYSSINSSIDSALSQLKNQAAVVSSVIDTENYFIDGSDYNTEWSKLK